MRLRFYTIGLMMLAALLAGCAGLQPGYEPPTLEVTGVRLDPSSRGAVPQFLIGLRVINPNRQSLRLDGISYNLYLQEQRVLSGVARDLPDVAGYSSRTIEVSATPALFGSIRLLSDLMNSPQIEALDYRVEAKLDGGGLQWPVRVEEQGRLPLMPAR
ncbi:LEA type 2 family protein [Marinobacterium sediminicola]|uniref:LEA14-like dessication related protein n=1 Tax=Marinobacterium sediminicola TaxID=518898 RepID=A0ABY1S0K6_9GAMM|nr:LEA type 2 family protein [Marinobacterium sediminicola]ULG69616.1 LEA type 2 family protein [Marinobacterium sediminicola]SMR74656.1 LEA14-like dessication related protein [Marinobacterium sediminicola]